MNKKGKKQLTKAIKKEMFHSSKRDDEVSKKISDLYDRQKHIIETEIRSYIQRYNNVNTDNGVPISVSKKKATREELDNLQKRVAKYLEDKNRNSPFEYELDVNNILTNISRLELLQYTIDIAMLELGDEEYELAHQFLNNEYFQGLNFQADILGDNVLSISQMANGIQSLLNEKWHEQTWSKNIWDKQDKLRQAVSQIVADSILRGKNPVELMRKIAREFKVANYQAKRLLITEATRVNALSQIEMMKRNGYEYFEIVPELSACEICRSKSGQVIAVSRAISGDTIPPFHPHCKCGLVASVKGDEQQYYTDITDEWLFDEEFEPNVTILDKFKKDGKEFVVDGRFVVQDHSKEEYEVAEWLSRKTGKKVELVPRVNFPKGILTPDYLINDTPFDLKIITGNGKNVIDGNLRKAKKQSKNILFDITTTKLTTEEVIRQLKSVYRSNRRGLDISILKKNNDIILVIKNSEKKEK